MTNKEFTIYLGNVYLSERLVLNGALQESVSKLVFLMYTSAIFPDWTNPTVFLMQNFFLIYLIYSYLYIDLIFKLCKVWMLLLNIDKCIVLHIKKNHLVLTFFINSFPLSTVEIYLYLWYGSGHYSHKKSYVVRAHFLCLQRKQARHCFSDM